MFPLLSKVFCAHFKLSVSIMGLEMDKWRAKFFHLPDGGREQWYLFATVLSRSLQRSRINAGAPLIWGTDKCKVNCGAGSLKVTKSRGADFMHTIALFTEAPDVEFILLIREGLFFQFGAGGWRSTLPAAPTSCLVASNRGPPKSNSLLRWYNTIGSQIRFVTNKKVL